MYFVFTFYRKRNHFFQYNGFFAYDIENNELISIPRYEFSKSLNKYIYAAFAENKAIRTLWDKEPLSVLFSDSLKKEPRSFQLIRELMEYYVIRKLSNCLDEHFNSGGINPKKLKYFSRKDVPDVLIENRFMDLFTKPIEDRSFFVEFENGGKRNKTNSVSKIDPVSGVKQIVEYEQGGALYEFFQLVLPRSSKIRRLSENKIELTTTGFTLRIATNFDGLYMTLPDEFERLFLKADGKQTNSFRCELTMEVKFNLGALLSNKEINYYSWIEDFVGKIRDEVSADIYFDNIGWNVSLTTFQLIDNTWISSRESIAESKTVKSEDKSKSSVTQTPIGNVNKDGTIIKLSGKEFKILQEALLDAFASKTEIGRMVRFQLNENLESIVAGDNLSELVFQLIVWAERTGRIKELIMGALQLNPSNSKIMAVAEAFLKPHIENLDN